MAIGAMTADVAGAIKNPGDVIYTDLVALVGDSSYPTGGMTGVEAAFQTLTKTTREVLSVDPVGACGGYVPRWDYANKKLQLFVSNGAAPNPLLELANATNVSGTTFKLRVTSR